MRPIESLTTMFIEDSKTSLRVITTKDTHIQKGIVTTSPGMYKRSSAPDRSDGFHQNPFFEGHKENHDSRPTVPVRRFSKHNSETAKDALEMRASFLSELIQLDESIQDDFDDETSTMESSVVSDITNPTVFLSVARTESLYSIESYSSETYTPEVQYQRLSSSSGSKDLPPRPVARELTASSQDFEPSVESAPTSPPPMPPPPRPFAPGQNISPGSQESPISDRDEVPDNDIPPRPFSRRLTESNLILDLSLDADLDDSSTEDSIEKPTIQRERPSALTRLAIEFLQGVAVGTNYHRLKKYDHTFVGRDAVDFMIDKGFACSREDAVFLGQRLQKELNLFYHVSWDHSLKDGNYFYRFTDVTEKCVSDHPRLSSLDLLKIAEAFERDVKVSSHFHHFMTYKRTFVGTQAVDYLVNSGLANCRKHAVFLGQRLLEDLNLFHHVTHSHQFKDANLFYRFSRCDCDASSATSDDASSISMGSLIMALQKRSKGSNDMKPKHISVSSLRKSPLRSSLRLADSSELKPDGRAVTFGSVGERVFERTLEMHPATRSGPSIGLGWNYEDKPSVPIRNAEPAKATPRNKKDFLLSSNTRKNLLGEWGHSKMEMFLASRVNEKIKEQRKRSLNKITVKTLDTEAMPCRSSPFPSFR
mmetsp:Transcript_14089/g.34134  ORF Transcript_14089/g.34134 Transcript_14089/m.34134 type:complete len:648 (-) Transcript_14089:53-1996(-)